MTPIVKNNSVLIWGKAMRDAKIYFTRTGKRIASFSIMYDRHHNSDGQKVNEYIEVACFSELATFIGDDNIGVAKGDLVIIFGNLAEETYRKPGEDPNTPKYKIFADIVLDATSIFQIASLVVTGDSIAAPNDEEHEESRKSIYDAEVKTPFEDEIDSAEGELPY